MLGAKLKELREAKGFVQRQVASKLEVDTAYVSKMENNEKPVSKNHLKKLAVLFDFPERELHTLWLADKLYGITKNEPDALKAVTLIQKQLQKK